LLQVGLKRLGFDLSDTDLHFLVDYVDSGGASVGERKPDLLVREHISKGTH